VNAEHKVSVAVSPNRPASATISAQSAAMPALPPRTDGSWVGGELTSEADQVERVANDVESVVDHVRDIGQHLPGMDQDVLD
jgi:hypothetical protein